MTEKAKDGNEPTPDPSQPARSVEQLRRREEGQSVTASLNGILGRLREALPKDAVISFDFDGRLHLHVDTKTLEDVAVSEVILPRLGIGLQGGLRRGDTPNRPFHHRISAVLDI